MPDEIVPQKRCSKCGNEYPATAEFFHRNQRNKDGLKSFCKACNCAASRQYNAGHSEKVKARARQYTVEHSEELKAYKRQYYVEHREKVNAKNRQWYIEHREEDNARSRQGYAEHREERIAYSRQWKAEHPGHNHQYRLEHLEQITARHHQHYIEHREENIAYSRQYKAEHPELRRVHGLRYRARKRGLPCTFTAEQERRMLDYFNHSCAVCGRSLNGLWHYAAADHWIPLTDKRPDNPGTVPANMVPLCHGVDGCNNSKYNHDPVVWLNQQFGKRKAAQILKRIEAYFEWVRQQELEKDKP